MDKFIRVTEAINQIRQGNMVIVTDDEDRENEGDLIMAGQLVTSDSISFMANYGKGLICAPISKEYACRLGLNLMTTEKDKQGTAFTISCDLKIGTTTGISSEDRAKTIRALANPLSKKEDFNRPGHIFPLLSESNGVLDRLGHTEAAIDLAVLAGCTPCGAICEIINSDGTMARAKDLDEFQLKHKLKRVTIKELLEYKKFLFSQRPITIPTDIGSFFIETIDNPKNEFMPHVLIYSGELKSPLNLRIHSECFTGDLLGSLRCDCGDQLNKSMEFINKNGGAVFYLRQEGRGIGLVNKLRAYNLQDIGLDTLDANLKLGFKEDEREYSLVAKILKERGVTNVNLLTNNPLKVDGLIKEGIVVDNRISLQGRYLKENKKYLNTKRDRMGHLLSQGV